MNPADSALPAPPEEEEEEELAALSMLPSSSPRRAPTTGRTEKPKARHGSDEDDEFDLSIAYIPANKRTKAVGIGSSKFSSLAPKTDTQSRRVGAGRGDGHSTAGEADGVAMDRDPLSVAAAAAVPDDTDFTQDEKEYVQWRRRRAALLEKLKNTHRRE